MQRIDTILASQYRGTALQPVVELAQLADEWPRLAGEPWASQCQLLRLHNGTLFVGVPDASWSQRLALEAHKLTRKVSQFLGYAVRIRQRVVGGDEALADAWAPVEPRADDPLVVEALKDLPDGPLRDALQGYLSRLIVFQESTRNPPFDGDNV